MRIAGITYGLMMIGWAASAQAAAPLTPAEMTVCKSVKHCVDIVERHNSGAYDYTVLHGEFLRFGDKGKAALLAMLSGKDEADMRRAQTLLAKGRFRFTPDEQRTIAALWPRGDLQTHAAVMRRSLSPLMRARMIDTLGHKDDGVRTISREIIAATISMKMDFPLKPKDYGKLARAALSEPTPAILELLSTFDDAKTAPIYARLLKSGDGPSTIAAYQKLYAQNQKIAFETLLGTLYDLTESDAEAAFALAAMLRERHKIREDGFYLKFAKDIAQDNEMSPMGRLVGFDAIMRSSQNANAPLFDRPKAVISVLKTALANMDNPAPYLRNFPRQAKDNPDPWLGAFWGKFQPTASNDKLDFLRLVGGFETDAAKAILREALGDKRDWRILQAAALPLGRMRDKQSISALKGLSSHPIMAVQVAALTALDGIKTGEMKGRAVYWLDAMKSRSSYCQIPATDFEDEAKTMPYFQDGKMASYSVPRIQWRNGKTLFPAKTSPARRRYLTAAEATQDGFLAGYSNGEFGGGLLYYDNQSGRGRRVLANSTRAIIPVKKMPLGQYANTYWVFVDTNDAGIEEYAIYRVDIDNLEASRLQAYLPSRPTAIYQEQGSSVAISFGQKSRNTNINPPLLLSTSGAIRHACKPQPDRAEALP